MGAAGASLGPTMSFRVERSGIEESTQFCSARILRLPLRLRYASLRVAQDDRTVGGTGGIEKNETALAFRSALFVFAN